ncbi:MAG: glycosyltransferase family 4 protein, partial [Polaromonas sp.]|nr:glycosyltransferase family 4 protein [Gemmatimonadaceae bacterium]
LCFLIVLLLFQKYFTHSSGLIRTGASGIAEVLAVGAAERRKNLGLLARAMPRVIAAHPGVTLVLAGPRRDAQVPVGDVAWSRTLGFVSDEELAALYREAAVFVMPSTYEGFGLPVLEAMRLGTPVICARGSSLPEVAGDAALWVDGDDDSDLAHKISQLLSDHELAARMRAASRQQAARFSWDDTARATIAAFEEAIQLVTLETTEFTGAPSAHPAGQSMPSMPAVAS